MGSTGGKIDAVNTPFELAGFEPLRRVGGGGFGDVWLARQTNVDRQVAVKVGHAPIEDETIRLRFDRECKALGRLSGHPNIVGVFTAGTLNDGRPYLVLEYVDGGTLWQRLKRAPLTDVELVDIGQELAAALEAAHQADVLHRDLKPENILIRSGGGAVLGDFGIARIQDGANTTSASITASVAYAAPEVLSAHKATPATDLYGIGVCLLAAAIRAVPFVEKTDESIQPILKRVLSDRHPDLAKQYGVDSRVAEFIDRLLEKEPGDRPQTAAEVRSKFTELRAHLLSPQPKEAIGSNVGPPPVDVDSQESSEHATSTESATSADSATSPDDQAAPNAKSNSDESASAESGSGTAGDNTAADETAGDNTAVAKSDEPDIAPPQPPKLKQETTAGQSDGERAPTTAGAVKGSKSDHDPTAEIRTFLLAYTVTVIIGGLILLLLI